MREQSQADIIRSVLVHTRLFADCDKEAVDLVYDACELQHFADGETLARFGDDAASVGGFWIIATGCLETSRNWANGKRIVYSYQMPGQLTAFLPVFDGAPVALDIVARGAVSAVFVPGAAFLDALRRYPALALSVLATMSRRTRVDYNRIEMQALNSMRGNVAKILAYLAREKLQEGSGNADLPFKISQEDLAGLLGVTRQNVNKEITWFVRQGILAWRYREVAIIDVGRLLEVAGSEEELNDSAEAALLQSPDEFYLTSD
ncbi:MAG: Crp/Fnr family transcriptional regulator [Parvibaculum sp.]|nr:Crp/Fnr family transcriptional regulator [Parvibaculum sp.]